eukprot:6195456-Pleurochrysis_carterae.AAC.1
MLRSGIRSMTSSAGQGRFKTSSAGLGLQLFVPLVRLGCRMLVRLSCVYQVDLRGSNIRSLGKMGKDASFVKFDMADLSGARCHIPTHE